MRDVIIAPQQEGKGRTFRATLLASVEADLMWEAGRAAGDTERPIWAMFAGSDQELRSFVANLRVGRRAVYPKKANDYSRGKEDRMEFLKSAGFRQIWQREEEGSLVTLCHPDLFLADPGMVDPKVISFVLLPSRAWHAAQKVDVAPVVSHLRRYGYKVPTDEQLAEWAVTAYLFAVYLDRRTRGPLVADGRFYAQLMLRCLQDGLATFSRTSEYGEQPFGVHPKWRYIERNTTQVGLLPGISYNSSHEALEELLAQEVDKFFTLTRKRHG